MGSPGAMLRPFRLRERPKRAQAPPRSAPRPPREPQGPPRGSQRLRRSSLRPLLGLSWGSLEQSLCLANLSFTEAKPRVAKMEDFEYKISSEAKCQKTIESSSKIYTTLARELQNASAGAIFPFLRHLRRQDNRDCTFENLSFIEVKRWVMKKHQKLTKNDDAKSRKTTFQNSTKNSRFFLPFSCRNPHRIELLCGTGDDFKNRS